MFKLNINEGRQVIYHAVDNKVGKKIKLETVF